MRKDNRSVVAGINERQWPVGQAVMVKRLAVGFIALIGLAGCGKTPAVGTTRGTTGTPSAVVAALAPNGTLRVAVPAQPPLFAYSDPATGGQSGVGIALARALAAKLGVRYAIVSYPDPGAVAGSAASSAWDVGIAPVNPMTVAKMDFSAPFLLLPHAYVVKAASSIKSLAEADRPGVRIASVRGSPHTAMLVASLKHAHIVLVDDVAAGTGLLRSGKVDAFADARTVLDGVVKQAAGLRIVEGNFFVARFALSTPKGASPSVLSFLNNFITDAKASGLIQQAIMQTGKPDLDVAP